MLKRVAFYPAKSDADSLVKNNTDKRIQKICAQIKPGHSVPPNTPFAAGIFRVWKRFPPTPSSQERPAAWCCRRTHSEYKTPEILKR